MRRARIVQIGNECMAKKKAPIRPRLSEPALTNAYDYHNDNYDGNDFVIALVSLLIRALLRGVRTLMWR